MTPPQWAYQLENFVNKPDDELICSICHSVFCNPVMSPCDHVFCRLCITKWLQNNRNCPICRKRVPRYSIKQIVPIVKNLIMKLTLYCKNKDQGCESQFSLEGCESHMKECNFELMQCKNKPCKEKLFRKDLDEHETNGCPHRYIKCKSCGSKMSLLSTVDDHDCITSLQSRLRRKTFVLRKRNAKIKELRDEIKNLKEAPRGSVDSITTPSTVSSASRSPDEIRINIAESLTSDSDESSDSIIAIIANSTSFSSDGNQSETFESFLDSYTNDQHESTLDLSEYRNAGSQTIDLEDDSPNRNGSSPENELNPEEDRNSESEERSVRRRPPKRRLPPPLFSTSEDENDSEERQSWSSSKRSWLLPLTESNDAPPENITGDSGSSFTEAGPSGSYSVEDHNQPSNDSASNTRPQFRSTAERNTRTSRLKTARARKMRQESKSTQGSAVFERTLALLEQYNLESDPEWFPEYASHRGNTTTESDSSYDELEVIENSSTSLSESDSDYSSRI